MSRLLCASLFLAISFACFSQGEEPKESTKSVDGVWLASAVELGGTKLPDEVRMSIKLVIDQGKYTVTLGKNPDRGTVKVDASKMPKEMDITGTEGPNKGKKILAIYEKTGDSLQICYDLGGKSRPTEFKSEAGTKLFLATYKREKP